MNPTRWGSDPEFYGPRHQVRLRLMLDYLRPHLPPQARILDVGAGAGRLATLLVEAGHLVDGIEPSPEFVAFASAHAPEGARFTVGHAEHLPFESATFDAVVAGEVLEHLNDDGLAVREMFRVLKPGGVLLLTVPADPDLWDLSDEWAGHCRRYTDDGLTHLLVLAGFSGVRVLRYGFPFMRLYHRWVYVPFLRRKQQRGDRPLKAPSAALTLLFRIVESVFALDRYFDGAGSGLGLLAWAFKLR